MSDQTIASEEYPTDHPARKQPGLYAGKQGERSLEEWEADAIAAYERHQASNARVTATEAAPAPEQSVQVTETMTPIQQLDAAFRHMRGDHPDVLQNQTVVAEGEIAHYREEIDKVESDTARLQQLKEAIEQQITHNDSYVGDLNVLLSSSSRNLEVLTTELNKRKASAVGKRR